MAKHSVRDPRAKFFGISLDQKAAGRVLLPLVMEPRSTSIDVQISRGGAVVGSFALEKVASLVKAGSIHADDYYWHEGLSDWRVVGETWPAAPDQDPAPARELVESPRGEIPVKLRKTTFRMVMSFVAFCGVLITFFSLANGFYMASNVGVVISIAGVIGWALAAVDDWRSK